MEDDTNALLDKSRRLIDSSNVQTSDKSRRGGHSGRGSSGGKRGGGEGRSRGGRGRRGSGKLVDSTRGSLVSVAVQNPGISKPNFKPKTESREPPLLEVGHKVVVRRLPPTLPQNILLEAVNSLAFIKDKYEWSSFINGKASDKPSKSRVFSRAYFRFTDSISAVKFMETFNGHVFIDSKGVQDQAVVEFAPYRKTPKQARTDPKQGTIEEDPEYQDFLVSLTQQTIEPPALPSASISSEKLKITPLIEFLRAKKAAQVESRLSYRASKSSVTLLSRNDQSKNSDSPASQNSSNTRESVSKNKEDKKLKKSKIPKTQNKDPKPSSEFKSTGEEGENRRSRRRSRKKGPSKEEPITPFAPTQILKAPPKASEIDWPQPGSNSKSSQPVKESPIKIESSNSSELKPAPVRHVFTLTNGCLTQSTKASDSLDAAPPKSSRNNRRRRAPSSKPQTAS